MSKTSTRPTLTSYGGRAAPRQVGSRATCSAAAPALGATGSVPIPVGSWLLPLVVMLHGGGQDADGFARSRYGPRLVWWRLASRSSARTWVEMTDRAVTATRSWVDLWQTPDASTLADRTLALPGLVISLGSPSGLDHLVQGVTRGFGETDIAGSFELSGHRL